MKNYNEMANDVLRRIEEHNVIKQKRQKTIKRVVVPICSLCVAVILGVGLWQGDVFKVEPDLPPIDIVDTPTSEETVTSEIPSTSVSETTSEPVISEQIKPQSSQVVTPQPQKTIINVDPETAKMGFYATNILKGFPGGTGGKELTCQCKRLKRYGFNLWVRKICWRMAWQPTPVFLPRKSHEQSRLAGYSP